MPEATGYILDTGSMEAKELENAYAKEVEARQLKIDNAWNYYSGQHKKPLEVQSDGYDDNIILNQIRGLADRIQSFLYGDGLSFETAGDGQSEDTDMLLEQEWMKNNKEQLLQSIILSGTVEGHNAVTVEPVEDRVKLTRIKQKHFSAFFDPFDMSKVLWYRLQHKTKTAGKRIDYIKGFASIADREVDHTRDELWTILDYQWQDNKWVLVAEPFYYTYDIPPIVDWQNRQNLNEYYGFSDLEEAIDLNDSLNFLLSNMQRIIKHFADPKTIGIGFNAEEVIKTAVGGFFSINKPRNEIDVFNLEMQSDLMSSSSLSDKIYSAIWHSGNMVDPQSVKDQIGRLTNFGLRVLFNDAVKASEQKQTLYGEGFEKLNFSILDNLLRPHPERINTIWSDVLPEDNKEEVEALSLELSQGVISKQTYRELRGYDNEKEEERIAEEAANTVDNPLSALFNAA